MMQLVTVGSAAEQTGLSAKAIRLYERKGLLAEAERTEAGYRLFTPDDIAVLHFIRRAKTWTWVWRRSRTSLTSSEAASSPANGSPRCSTHTWLTSIRSSPTCAGCATPCATRVGPPPPPDARATRQSSARSSNPRPPHLLLNPP